MVRKIWKGLEKLVSFKVNDYKSLLKIQFFFSNRKGYTFRKNNPCTIAPYSEQLLKEFVPNFQVLSFTNTSKVYNNFLICKKGMEKKGKCQAIIREF